MNKILIFVMVLISIGVANENKSKRNCAIDTAVDFSVADVEGVDHHLFEYLDNGNYVLIEFTKPKG
jgi:hypothetical protein